MRRRAPRSSPRLTTIGSCARDSPWMRCARDLRGESIDPNHYADKTVQLICVLLSSGEDRRARVNVLLVSTTASWLAQARMPHALASAGFRVSLLAPPESIGARSRFLARCDLLPHDANRAQWEIALAAAVEAVDPRLVVPCDDMATHLLQ